VSVPSSKAGSRLSTSSLWRWNWHMVPKRRQITYWRRGNTQKNIYNNILMYTYLRLSKKHAHLLVWK